MVCELCPSKAVKKYQKKKISQSLFICNRTTLCIVWEGKQLPLIKKWLQNTKPALAHGLGSYLHGASP